METHDHIKEQIQVLFCSKKEDREQLREPTYWLNIENNTWYWCVTDAHTACLIPIEFKDYDDESKLDYGPAISGLTPMAEPFLFTLNEFKWALSKFDSQPDYDIETKECSACKGEGECKCECCDDRHDCNKCGGDGEIEISRALNGRLLYTQNDPLSRNQRLKLGSGIFNPNYISRIGNAIKIMGLTSNIIQVTHNSEKAGTLILVGEVMFLIMPMIPDDDTEIRAILPVPNI